MDVQAPTSMTGGYLLCMDAKTIDCKGLTAINRGSKYFAKLPTKAKIKELRLAKDQQTLDWNNPDKINGVTILDA